MLEVNVNKSNEEMDRQFMQEFANSWGTDAFKGFLDDWGMTEEDALMYAQDFPALDELINPTQPQGEDFLGIDLSNLESEPSDEDVANLLAMGDKVEDSLPIGAGITKVGKGIFNYLQPATKNAKMDKIVAQTVNKGKLDKFQQAGAKGEKAKKAEELAKNKSDAVKQGAAATTAATATALGLSGDRGPDGSLITQQEKDDIKWIQESTEDAPKVEAKKPEPKAEPKEERPGWKRPEGSNFWSVNTESDYWQTDEGAAEAEGIYGELPSWAKQPEVQELDLSGLANWFK